MSYFIYHGKKIFYREVGEGKPVLFLHGNTASSKMFEFILPLYQADCRVFLMDFLGNGRSDRVEEFPPALWIEWGRQAAALVRHLDMGKVSLVGTSGGAWSAVNAALECPELVEKVVADSFDGRSLHPGFARDLTAERDRAKRDKAAREFYAWCQGPDWEAVVDRDTDALLRCAASGRPLFCGPLEQMRPPVLLMGSREDPMCRQDLEEEYKAMAAQMPHAAVRLFASGGHPAILSRAEAAKEEILAFWLRCEAAERL